jgi:hypothetical protein
MKVKQLRVKKEIWPYVEGTILISYGGPTPHLYYHRPPSKQDEVPSGNGLNINWWVEKGFDYFDEYFESLDDLNFEDTPWATHMAKVLMDQRNAFKDKLSKRKQAYEDEMKHLKSQLNGVEQAWVEYFGTDINAEVLDLREEAPESPSYEYWESRTMRYDNWNSGSTG